MVLFLYSSGDLLFVTGFIEVSFFGFLLRPLFCYFSIDLILYFLCCGLLWFFASCFGSFSVFSFSGVSGDC